MNGPVAERQRFVLLDALRGLALLGIALANFPEFALWTFLSPARQGAMPSASADRAARLLQYFLVDGKFYTIFSLLFGVGFSLIMVRHGRRLFVRRMLCLACIGFAHLMFVWSGDILLLYAVGGLILVLLAGLSDRKLQLLAVSLIVLPVALDGLTEFFGVDFSAPFYAAWWEHAEARGISEANFATWLRDAHSYGRMFDFLVQGAYERMWEFVDGHRLPKVVGLFVLGYLIGKRRLYAQLGRLPLKSLMCMAGGWGVPMSLLYAWSATSGQPWGRTAHSLLYALSVVPMAFAYVAAFCLLFQRKTDSAVFRSLALPGRMALTNYLMQSVAGILLFYGIGLGLGTSLGLVMIELVAAVVFVVQILACRLWLHAFRFGPVEWLWRMLTYGHYFPIRRDRTDL